MCFLLVKIFLSLLFYIVGKVQTMEFSRQRRGQQGEMMDQAEGPSSDSDDVIFCYLIKFFLSLFQTPITRHV